MQARYRPGREAEDHARKVVRTHYPDATSQYTHAGARVYDPGTDRTLGEASSGDWGVEWAWQHAAQQNLR